MFTVAEYKAIVDETSTIAKSHILHGEKVLPGVVYIEICLGICKEQGVDISQVEFSNVMFYTPLNANCKRELIFVIERKKEQWIALAKSRKSEGEEYTIHFICNLNILQKEPIKRLDINSFINNANDVKDLDEAYTFARKAGIVHKGFMKPRGKVYIGDDAILGHIYFEASVNAKEEMTKRAAVFDCSTVLPYLSIQDKSIIESQDKAFIPLHIERFRSYGEIPLEAYIYVEKKDTHLAPNGDFCYASWEIADKFGNITNEFSQLSSKQIRETGLATAEVPFQQGKYAKAHTEDKKHLIKNVMSQKYTGDLRQKVIGFLTEIILDISGIAIEEEAYEEGFYELGMTSKDLISTVGAIESALKCQLYPTIMFEYSTIPEFAAYLLKEYPENIENYFNNAMSKVAKKSNLGKMPEIKSLCYEHEWVKDNKKHKEVMAGKKIVFVEKPIDLEDENLIVVVCSNSFCKKNKNLYEANPFMKEDYTKIFQVIGEENREILVISLLDAAVLEKYWPDEKDKNVYFHHLALCQGILESKLSNVRIVATAFHNDNGNIFTNALAGFYKCLVKETKKINATILSIMDTNIQNYKNVYDIAVNEAGSESYQVVEIYYENGTRYIKKVRKKENPGDKDFPQNAVYLCTGGMSKIIRHFIEKETLENNSTFVLLGRSELNEEKTEWMKKVNEHKGNVVYFKNDITDYSNTNETIKMINHNYGSVTGIIHAAGIANDELVRTRVLYENKKEPVLETKITGIHNILKALNGRKVDFLISFSSISAVFGNAGQSNYAYANCYLDHLVHSRKWNISNVISINWPIWKDGGMALGYDDDSVFRSTGLSLLDTQNGIRYLQNISKRQNSQTIFLMGEEEKIDSIIDTIVPIETADDSEQETTIVYNANAPVQPFMPEDIAIVGINGKFPKADTIEDFWENMKSGRDCISEVPEDRWKKEDIEAILGENDLDVCEFGGFLNDIDSFDTSLFHITPVDARNMDPQERLFLTSVWNLVEDAGYSKKRLENKDIGVFAACMWGQYQMGKSVIQNKVTLPSSIYASIANRVSYYFNWHGPSLTLDTMCSSAMTAIKYACDSLKNGECEMAVAGGVNLTLSPEKYIVLAQNHFTAQDGRCRSFGEGGTGYVPGEGVGSFLLKRLSDAKRDGDHIYGVIKACEINHGGKTSGYSVPSVAMQAKVIERALQRAEITAEDVGYIEAHGTGTSLGDPIEIRALQSVYEKQTDKRQFCSIGSVKSNIGHLEAASCVASLIKVLLQMKYKTLVPSIHSDVINPNIKFEHTAFYRQGKLEKWNCNGPRIAGISAFGAGGSNGHMIIQEYEEKKIKNTTEGPFLFVYSAQSMDILKELLQNNRDFLKKKEAIYIKEEMNDDDKVAITNDLKCYFKLENRPDFEKAELFEIGIDQCQTVKLIKFLEKNNYKVPDMETLLHLQRVEDLVGLIHKKGSFAVPDLDVQLLERGFLENYAYTLMMGRVSLEARVAIIAGSIKELLERMDEYLHKQTGNKVFHSDSLSKDQMLVKLMNSTNGRNYLKTLFDATELDSIAQVWCRGVTIDWENIISTKKRRLEIPVYPFSDEVIPRAQFSKQSAMVSYVEEANEENSPEDLFSIIERVKNGSLRVEEAERILLSNGM